MLSVSVWFVCLVVSLVSLTRFSIACLQALLAFVSIGDAAVEITTQHDIFAEVVRVCFLKNTRKF